MKKATDITSVVVVLFFLTLIVVCIVVCISESGNTGSEEQSLSEFAQDFEYNELTIDCDKSDVARSIMEFDSGDPYYKRITWQCDDNHSVDYIMEIYPADRADTIIASNDALYKSNAKESSWVVANSSDKQQVAIYDPSEYFPDGATIRLYYLTYNENFYVLTFEQRYLLTGSEGLRMTTDCDDIVADTVRLLKGEE